MPVGSINTNVGAIIALENLSLTQQQLQTTQNQISTGLKVATPMDNGAIWAIAQNLRSQVSALDSVQNSLNSAISTVDVAVSAGQTISDLLNQMQAKALAASDPSLDSTSRAALNSDFKSLVKQISTVVANANFNGANMIKTGGISLYALANASGTSRITVAAESLGLGGSNVTVASTASFATATQASNMLTTIATSIANVNNAVAHLGTGANALQSQLTLTTDLQNTLTTGIGNLVDANVAAASAELQALQTKQQLGVQALSIANAEPSVLLTLFR